jgi:hypothetical protein
LFSGLFWLTPLPNQVHPEYDMHLLSQLKDEHGLGMHGIIQAELLTAQKLRASFNGSQSS